MNSGQINENSGYFCYLYVRTKTQAWLVFSFPVIVAFLTIIAIRQFIKDKRSNKLVNQVVRGLYVLTLCWVIIQQIKLICAQLVFWHLYSEQQSVDVFQKYSFISKGLFVLDILSIFLFETTLMLVPLNWSQNIIQIFKLLNKNENQYKKYIKFDIFCTKFFKFYLSIRFFFLLLIFPFIFISDHEIQSLIVQSQLIIFEVQTGFLIIFLIFGLVATKNNVKLRELVEESEINKMIKQYLILIICTAVRFFTTIIFIYQNFYAMSAQPKCFIDTQAISQSELIIRIVDLVTEGPITHYLPFFVVLAIFNTNDQIDDLETLLETDIEKADSIIISKTGTQQQY